jgi:hypothetical protein
LGPKTQNGRLIGTICTNYSLQEKRYEKNYWFVDALRPDGGFAGIPDFRPG